MYLGFYTSAGGDNQCFLQETNPQEAAEAEMQKLGKQISIDYKVPPRFPRKKMTKFKEPHYPPRNHQVSSQEGNLKGFSRLILFEHFGFSSVFGRFFFTMSMKIGG